MTTGSHHQQIYWYATGHDRLLGQLPAIRLTADDRWIPRRSAVMHPPNVPLVSESGAWNAVCVACHTTQGKTALSTPWGAEPLFSQRIDTKAAEFGIACESCHGPASDHIRANSNPAATVLAAFNRSTPTRRRAAASARRSTIVRGVRTVSRSVGVLRRAGGNATRTQTGWPIVRATC